MQSLAIGWGYRRGGNSIGARIAARISAPAIYAAGIRTGLALKNCKKVFVYSVRIGFAPIVRCKGDRGEGLPRPAWLR